jgi:hypothetical protein
MTNQDKGTTSIVQTSFNHFSIISTLTDVHIFEDYVIGISEE